MGDDAEYYSEQQEEEKRHQEIARQEREMTKWPKKILNGKKPANQRIRIHPIKINL